MKVSLKSSAISGHKVYEVQGAKVEGADPAGYDWSFSFNYGNGSARIYAWVFLEGLENEVEFVLDERDGLNQYAGIDKSFTKVCTNVFMQAAHVRAALPDFIASWRANNPSLEDRLSLANVKVQAEDGANLAVVADLLVDGEKVYEVLEWLDEDGDLVRDDRHLDVNSYHVDAIEQATWGVKYTDFRDRASVRVNELLEQALAGLPTPPEASEGDNGDSVDYDPAAVTSIPFDELPVELGTEVESSPTGAFEAFKIRDFSFRVIGSDELQDGVAHVLLCKDKAMAGVAVDFGSASWFDVRSVEDALVAWTVENKASAAEFDELAAA